MHVILHLPDIEEAVIDFVYRKHYYATYKLIVERGGNEQDVQDVFQEAIIALYEKIKSGTFKADARIGTYLYVVSRNLWINKQKKVKNFIEINKSHEWIQSDESSTTDILIREQEEMFVKTIMQQLGENCRKVLSMAVYEDKGMKEIARLMGYAK